MSGALGLGVQPESSRDTTPRSRCTIIVFWCSAPMLPSLQKEVTAKSAECLAWTSSASDSGTPRASQTETQDRAAHPG